MTIMRKGLSIAIFSAFLFWGCEEAKVPQNEEDLVIGIKEGVEEFQELAKPNKVESWVDNLIVKSQPGKDMPELARLKQGEKATYLYQRTARKFEVELRGQTFKDSWYLIRTKDSLIGWVHGAGIRFLEFDLNEVIANQIEEPRSRGLDDPEDTSPTFTQDWMVIPGDRVGPIRVNTSESTLVTWFGPSNVVRGKVKKSLSETVPCTWLFKGQPDELAITWKNDARSEVKAVYFFSEQGKWKPILGIKPGMSLGDLVKINQAALDFYGLGWTYSGTVSSWKGGKLAAQEKYFYVALKAGKNAENVGGFQGENEFVSSGAGVDGLNLEVERLVVYLD